jgi:hypothetical protein
LRAYGKLSDAMNILAPIYEWFSEARVDLQDIQNASNLIKDIQNINVNAGDKAIARFF